jgi:carbamoyl-phosphate synthase large subunit
VAPKVGHGHPDIVERIDSGEIDVVFNTVSSEAKAVRDSSSIRRAALNRGLPYFTTLAALRAAAGAVKAMQLGSIGIRALQEIHPDSSS